MCRVQGCSDGHLNHYCKVCQSADSTHFARDCPQGIDIFHGTRVTNISSIMDNGLRVSPGGRLGPGIYFAEEGPATNVASHRSQGTGVIVLKVRVNASKCLTGMHPPWAGNGDFREWCLTDGKHYRIKAIYLTDGVVEGNINAPRVDIHTGGNCHFKGSVTAGRLVIGGNTTIG